MSKPKILIAGGLGFIGINMSRFLLSKGNNLIIIDNLSSSSIDNMKILNKYENFIFINEDICNLDINNIVFKNIKIIYNFATIASPKKYQINGIETIKANTIGLLNLLEIARLNNSLFFQASTSEVYGNTMIRFQNEQCLGNVNTFGPRACYDEGKRVAESICYEYINKYHISIYIGRIFNTYGPYMQHDDGRIIPNFILNALKGEDIIIYGDGNNTRSFMFIEDLIRGIELLIGSKINKPINIGTNINYKVIDVARKILFLTNSDSKIRFTKGLIDEPVKRDPDINFISKATKWSPNISFDKGLEETINYFKIIIGK